MARSSNVFSLNKGSDLAFSFNWPDGAGGNADLTGYQVDLYDVSSNLEGSLSVELSDPSEGLISVDMQWGEELSVHDRGSFRIRIKLGDLDVTTNELVVEVK